MKNSGNKIHMYLLNMKSSLFQFFQLSIFVYDKRNTFINHKREIIWDTISMLYIM